MHQEETASGISVDDMSEIDVLLEELVGKEESLNKVSDASWPYTSSGEEPIGLLLPSYL